MCGFSHGAIFMDVILNPPEAGEESGGGIGALPPRPLAEFTLSGDRFFALFRMTGSEGLRVILKNLHNRLVVMLAFF